MENNENIQGRVRRLTPVECERLQGLPECGNMLMFNADLSEVVIFQCEDCRKINVQNAVEICRKKQEFAGSAEKIELSDIVNSAGKNLLSSFLQTKKLVLVNVPTNFVESNQAILKGKKSNELVKNVEESLLLNHLKVEDCFVLLDVLIDLIVEKTVSNMLMVPQKNAGQAMQAVVHGIENEKKSLQEMIIDVEGVGRFIKKDHDSMYITFALMPEMKNQDLLTKILSCFVKLATTLSIPKEMCGRILLMFPKGFTAKGMTPEGKGFKLPDSARYKAIGNGMAQPCADWVISQIVAAESNAEGKEK